METNDNLTIQPLLHSHLFLQMVIIPRQQILPGPICRKESMGTIPRQKMNMIYDFSFTNTVNIVHKFVTIFAGYLDYFIVTNNHSNHLFSTSTPGSGQISVQMKLIPFAGTGKNCAIPGLHRDCAKAYRDNDWAGC